MLLLFSDPRVGLCLALEAGICAGKSADFVDVDGERAVRFRDDSIVSHAFEYGAVPVVRKPGVTPDPLPDGARQRPSAALGSNRARLLRQILTHGNACGLPGIAGEWRRVADGFS